jgi:Tfp pilus assembly protein PilX
MKNNIRIPSAARPWNRGAALFFALLTSILMLTIVLPFLFKVSGRFRVSEKSFKTVAALNLAEAGVERAIWELNYGNISLWSGDILTRTLTLNSVTAANGQVAGDIDIEVTNPSGDNPIVVSTGRVAWNDGLTCERKIRIVLTRGFESYFNFGIFGDDGFDLHGNAYCDSYNSEVAPYDPMQRGMNGDVGTNANQRWDVVLLNNTTIYGDVATGYLSDPEEVIRLSNNAEIVGARKTLDDPKALPDVPPPLLTPKGAFALNGTGTITESGMYSSFTMLSNSILTIVGDVQLYINGNFTMSSNTLINIAPGSHVELFLGNGVFEQDSNSAINNLSHDPKALVFIGTSDFHTLNWRSNSQFWGCMYVPRATINYSANSDFYGSIVTNYISMSSNAGIHYDESLGTWSKYGTYNSDYELKNWQEY